MIHSLADVRGAVGADATVMQFAVVEEGARIGARSVIGPHCFVGAGVVLGDDVHLEPGVRLVSPARIGDRVKFGPNVSLTDLAGAQHRNACHGRQR